MKSYWLDQMPWELYRMHYLSDDLPFLEENYLSALSPTWGTVIIEKQGKVQTLVPLAYRKLGGLYWLRQPLFIPYIGFVNWKLPTGTYKRFSEQEKLLTLFIQALPRNLLGFAYAWAPEWDFWLCAAWEKFKVYPAGTYRVFPTQKWEPAYLTRRILKKPLDAEFIQISLPEAQYFYGEYPPSPPTLHKARRSFQRILPFVSHWAVRKQNQVTLVASFSENVSGMWYFASSQSDLAIKENHLTHLFAYLISECQHKGKFFDFEGSQLKNIEFFFRRFGGQWLPYYIWKKRLA